MRHVARAAIALASLVGLAALAWFGGLGPRAAIPGGVLWGPLAEPPADWSFTDAIAEIQVQTHVGPLPWSVTTWVLSHDGDLFIAASECDRVWTGRVKADPEIRLRVDGTLYEMRARPEADPALGAQLAPVVLHKYFGIAAEAAHWIPGATRGCIFRVEPRS